MEDKVFIVELAKALKEKRSLVFVFIGPDGTSIRCAVDDGNILYIEGLYGTGKSEIERIVKWKKGKVIERPLRDEDRLKKAEFIDPNPIISVLEKFEDKKDLRSEFQKEILKLLKYLIIDLEKCSFALNELLNSNSSKSIYYIEGKGFLFLSRNKVEGFLNNLGKFINDFYSNENLIISKLSIEEWEYEVLKLPFYNEPEIEGKVANSLLNGLLRDIFGLFFISQNSMRIIVLKGQNNMKIYTTSPNIEILDGLNLNQEPYVLIYSV